MLANLTTTSVSPIPAPPVAELPERIRNIDPSGCADWKRRQEALNEEWVKKVTVAQQ